jgi:hypothetical protein
MKHYDLETYLATAAGSGVAAVPAQFSGFT